MKRKPIRGILLFSLAGQALLAVQKHGLVLCLVHYLPRFLSRSGAGILLWVLKLAWNARKVWYWRWSSRVSIEDYQARDAVCMACEHQKIVGPRTYKGFLAKLMLFLFPPGRYCQQCGCADWRWSELTVKNTRKGHICPRGKHPGQTPVPQQKRKDSCPTCGGKKTNGRRKDADRLEVPVTLERTELSVVNRR